VSKYACASISAMADAGRKEKLAAAKKKVHYWHPTLLKLMLSYTLV